MVRCRTVDVEGIKIVFREAGDPAHPSLLLLHGFPSSSHMFRQLNSLLADRFYIVARDLPGFGFTEVPRPTRFQYTFDNLGHFALETHTDEIAAVMPSFLGKATQSQRGETLALQ